jgi:hypothetical protein
MDTIEFAKAPLSPNGTAPDVSELEKLFVVPQEDLETEEVDGVSDFPEIGKPGKQAFFRVHSESLVAPLLRIDGSREFYLCARDVEHPEVRDYRLFLTRTKAGKLLIWPVALPRMGEYSPASRQQRAIAAAATSAWASMRWVGGKAGHHVWKVYPEMSDVPSWPAKPLLELILIAFDDRVIRRVDDPRLAELPYLAE